MTITNERDVIRAEKIAAVCRKFLSLTKDGVSLRLAAKILGKSTSFFSGHDSYLARFQRGEQLVPGPRDTSAMIRFHVPPWFIPVCRVFYLYSNLRRNGGSVPEAVRRTIALPSLPAGWTDGQRSQLLKYLKLDAVPACPPELRQDIQNRERQGKDLVPPRIAKQITIPGAIIQRYRSPRASALDNLSAPGSQRRYYNATTGRREIMCAGDWFGGDDATPGIAVCVPSSEINTPCSQRYGVLLGRFQWLAFHDGRTDKILASDHVVRPRGSYRAEDILNGMGAVTRTHGIPRIGWQFEGGSWNAKLIRHAIELLGCQRWRTYSPHQKAIESVFNRVWTRLAVQFPHADMGRYRNENEVNCRLYEECKRGHKNPIKYFPPLDLVLKAFDEEIAWHNSKPINSKQYGQWVPDELFRVQTGESKLRPFSEEIAWIFSPFTAQRKIQGSVVHCRVPMFEDFSVPFEFSAPWMPLHRGKLIRLHFNPREPKCRAKIVLCEDSGQLKPGHILGDADLVGETAQHVRFIMNWAADDQRAGYLARQRTAHFLSRHTRGFGDLGRVEYSVDERRDGLGAVAKIERGKNAGSSSPGLIEPERPLSIDPETLKGRSLIGKIARLPESIRDEVSQRMADGQTLHDITSWLNSLPEVEKIMSEQFNGRPIILENVGQWKKRGHLRWLQRREAVKLAQNSRADRSKRLADLESLAKQSRF
jgi:hypothetical protein